MKYLSQIASVLAAITITSTSVVKPPSITTGDGNFELLILHNNDMHARFEQTSQLSGACTIADREAGKCYGGFPRVAHVVKEARRAAASGEGPPVLYLNAGDTYTGTAWFTIYKWKIAAEFINALQPDAVSLGNHELDAEVEGVVPFIKNLTTPVLAANLILDKVPELKSEPNLRNSTVIIKNGVKIGIIGYLTPDTKFLAPKNDIEYEDEVIAMRREVAKLKEQGVNILIGLGHSGYIKDLEIAGKVEDLDLVIGGHSNTFLSNNNNTKEIPEVIQGPYPVWVMQASGRKVPVVQAYAYTKYMGKLRLIFDSDGEITECDGAPILLNQKVPKDPELEALVETYRENMDIVNNEVLGTSMVLLNGESCRLRECNMGNLITDTVMLKTKKYMFGQYSDVNMAIIQGGRIRASIFSPATPPFNLTRGDWITVLPFSDSLSIITMNGTILLQMLEHSVRNWRTLDTPGQFLQFSGLKVVYDLSKPPGFRVAKAKILSLNDNDPTLYDVKDSHTYKVIMCTFLADGGDEFVMFEGLEREILPYNELTTVTEYLQEFSPVNPKVSDRIIIINEDSVDEFGNFIPTYSVNLGRTMTSKAVYLTSQTNYVIIVVLLMLM